MTETRDAQPTSPLQVLDNRQCWAYLQQEELGRLAVTIRGETDIFPVNYLADRGRILIRTAPGTKLIAVLINNRVTFEIDGHDDQTAWSVIVKGVAEELPNHLPPRQERRLPTPWVPEDKDAIIEITPSTVTGRFFHRRPRPDDAETGRQEQA